jgi:hypothetical protein
MNHPLFDSRHLKEYLLYGLLAALVYIIPCWLFFAKNDYNNSWYLYVGCVLFMAVVLIYNMQLTKRRSDGYSALKMLMAGHTAAIVGIVFACIAVFIFSVIYMPQHLSSSDSRWLNDAPVGVNNDRLDLLTVFAITIIGNFAASAFISIMCSYAMKYNQTKDKPSPL